MQDILGRGIARERIGIGCGIFLKALLTIQQQRFVQRAGNRKRIVAQVQHVTQYVDRRDLRTEILWNDEARIDSAVGDSLECLAGAEQLPGREDAALELTVRLLLQRVEERLHRVLHPCMLGAHQGGIADRLRADGRCPGRERAGHDQTGGDRLHEFGMHFVPPYFVVFPLVTLGPAAPVTRGARG